MKFEKYYQELLELNVGTILKDEPLYKHTTYRVGGPARLFIKVKDVEGLISVIGRGSNLLFSDKSFEGIIISLENMNHYSINGSEVVAQSGVAMIKLAYDCAKVGLSGFEFMGGIPGNIGGGIFMNAGAYKSCLSEVVKSVKVLNENLRVVTLTKEEMEFSYRRMSSQPWNKPSAGSVFRNPEGNAAWKLIDDAKLRGYEIGGAQVSPKHSNFIVNNGYASAKDIYDLIFYVQKTVQEQSGVLLKPEVRFINWEL